jgi:signal peptidase I
VVIFRLGEAFLVKRVARLPGDPVQEESVLTVRGVARSGYPSLGRAADAPPTSLRSCPRVPNGHVYVLGDNSAVSEDSRHFGPVRAAAVVGRIVP